jgi:hypothetical protein
MQLRVLGARKFMLERRGNEITAVLAMTRAGDLLAGDGVLLHQRECVAHGLVMGFDDRLVAPDQCLHRHALRRREREVPPVALGSRLGFEGDRDTPAVRQAAFEERSKPRRVHFAAKA